MQLVFFEALKNGLCLLDEAFGMIDIGIVIVIDIGPIFRDLIVHVLSVVRTAIL